eukprot:3267336-Pleurochrysis_carterae.AAC.1
MLQLLRPSLGSHIYKIHREFFRAPNLTAYGRLLLKRFSSLHYVRACGHAGAHVCARWCCHSVVQSCATAIVPALEVESCGYAVSGRVRPCAVVCGHVLSGTSVCLCACHPRALVLERRSLLTTASGPSLSTAASSLPPP